MPDLDDTRTEQIEVWLVPDVHAAIERAAELRSRSVADFIVAAAQEAAYRAIADASIIRLSAEDQRAISDGVVDPQPPNDVLRHAAAAHRRLLD